MAGFFSSLFRRGGKTGFPRLKARYHIFRVMLSDNERSLAAIAEADRLLHENEAGTLAIVLEELCEAALELADGLNRLTGGGHRGIYPLLEDTRARLSDAQEKYSRAPRGMWIALAAVTPDMREQAGGKAQPLGGLIRAGVNVPDGFVILRRSCRAYLREAKLEERLGAILHEAADGGADLEALSKRAQAMILASEPAAEFLQELGNAWESLARGGPLSISVRSSASGEDGREHSFAGQYASVLGVNSKEALMRAFKEALASAFSPRAMAYRLKAGLGRQSVDMAVLCQRMVDAKTAGVLFTMDPMAANDRMLLTAVPGLGELAVSGRAPADVYHPSRLPEGDEDGQMPREIAVKTLRVVPAGGGGVRLETVDEAEGGKPLLTFEQVEELRLTALRIEALAGCVQDIEWSMDKDGVLWILQARPAHLARTRIAGCESGGNALLDGGTGASPGKAAGEVVVVRVSEDMAVAAKVQAPVVLVLRQPLAGGAAFPPNLAGIVTDMGSPLDEMACLARENAIPMVTGLSLATTTLTPGQWVLADGDRGAVFTADARLWQGAPRPKRLTVSAGAAGAAEIIRSLVMGPDESLRGLIFSIHEKALAAHFETGQAVCGQNIPSARSLKNGSGPPLFIIDLGGALAPGSALLCEPLAVFWDALSGPEAAVDAYALATRDSFTLHARTNSCALMVDAACGEASAWENSIHTRFTGEDQKVALVEETLRGGGFAVNRQARTVSADFMRGTRDRALQQLEKLGCSLRAILFPTPS